MIHTPARVLAGLIMLGLSLAAPLSAEDTATNPVCKPGILRDDGSFDLARIGPLIAGAWTEQAYGVSVATGVQTSSLVIVHDALRGRIYVQADGTQIPLTMVRGDRRLPSWDYQKNKPIPNEELVLEKLVGGFNDFLKKENCDWGHAPQFSWEFRTPRGTSAGYLTFISPSAGIGMKWNSAMGTREQVLKR
jgi:hypothetical protein